MRFFLIFVIPTVIATVIANQKTTKMNCFSFAFSLEYLKAY